MTADGRKYRWEGHVLYVAELMGRTWGVAYDIPGQTGANRNKLYRIWMTNQPLNCRETRRKMQARLDRWAEKNGLKRVE